MRRWRRAPLRVALLAGIGLWAACAPPRPLRVEYAGCAEVHVPGPICVLKDDRVLQLWVDLPPETEIEIRAGGRRLESAATPVQGGQRFRLEVPPGAENVEVRADTPEGRAAWSLAFGPPRGGPAAALSKLAREARESDPAEAQRKLLIAIPGHQKAGSLLAAVKDATLLAYFQIQERRLAAARQVLSQLRLPAGSPAEAAYVRSYHQGLLAEHAGDARTALIELQNAADQAQRVGLEAERLYAEQVMARQLQALGRSREAAELFDRLRRSSPQEPCVLGDLLLNQAWSLLLAGEAGEFFGDPVPLFQRAELLLGADCGWSVADELNLHLNLALAHLQHGRLPQARANLAAAGALAAAATPLQRLWQIEVEARLHLADGRPAVALQLYDDLDNLAVRASSPEGRWRAAYGRALCRRALGSPAAAIDALAGAESLLDAQSLQIPIQEGRETFLAQRESGTRLHLELLLAGERNPEALAVARRARSRVLRQLARGERLAHLTPADQQRWADALAEYWRRRGALEAAAAEEDSLPADQLRRARERRSAESAAAERFLDEAFRVLGETGAGGGALPLPNPGELILTYHPLPQGWVGFADDGRTVAVHRFGLPGGLLARSEDLAKQLLDPFRGRIRKARRVRVLPYGALRDVDFHALPFDGDLLIAACPVVYGLDLAPLAKVPSTGGRRALVVGNPLGNLPAAAREAEAVAASLRGQRPAWSTEVLQGEAASAEAVRRALPGADLLHYAGHGAFAGFSGWRSILPLAGDTRLTLGDLLALDRAPAQVVLSGCETGRSGGDAPVEGLGLAQAFLLAGSRSVLAATRPVDDRAAQGFFTELYRQRGPAADLATGLQQTQLAWRRSHAEADWASFRLFEP